MPLVWLQENAKCICPVDKIPCVTSVSKCIELLCKLMHFWQVETAVGEKMFSSCVHNRVKVEN